MFFIGNSEEPFARNRRLKLYDFEYELQNIINFYYLVQ